VRKFHFNAAVLPQSLTSLLDVANNCKLLTNNRGHRSDMKDAVFIGNEA